MSRPDQLLITEIFYSLQGESTSVGLPTVFIRLTGCPLRCQYCDTSYAFTGGEYLALDDIMQQVKQYATAHVTVTGGEPLAQSNCLLLLNRLCDDGYKVSLETSGALDVSEVDTRVMKVVDIKTPDSDEADKNRFENLQYLTSQDQLKFVLCSRQDYDWAKKCIDEYQLTAKCEVLFSPSFEQLNATELADWVLQDQLNVRMQLQLHKILWGNQPGR
jgi:7-carboxy-7-deazaguanine synthase